jgi:hypothetical protein
MTEKTIGPCYMHLQGTNCGSETVGGEVLRMAETWIFLYMHVFPMALTFHTNNHAEYCTQPALQAYIFTRVCTYMYIEHEILFAKVT